MQPISLSKSKVKDARRLGGIELLVLWPEDLPQRTDLGLDQEWSAHPNEARYARTLVRDACREHKLTVVDVRAVNRHRVGSLAVDPGVHRMHLSIHIVGDEWADKTVDGGKRGVEHFHVPAGRPLSSDRKPRNVQMSDEVYALLERVGGGRAADGLEEIARAYGEQR